MINLFKYCALSIIVFSLFFGCSSQPAQEINAAKAAVDNAMAEGAEKYAQEETRKINDELTAAMNEIKAQEEKFFKNYAKAKELLAKVKTDAETLKAGLASKKEAAKKNALSVHESAKSAADGVKTILSSVPKGKISKDEMESIDNAFLELEESLSDVQKLIDNEDFNAAIARSNEIKEKAANLSDRIKLSVEKTASKKK